MKAKFHQVLKETLVRVQVSQYAFGAELTAWHERLSLRIQQKELAL
jgi:hypothetical protein